MAKSSVIIFIFFLALTTLAAEKGVRFYDKKEKPRVEQIEQDTSANVECLRADRPYIVLSKRDKFILEGIVSKPVSDMDPNMAMP